MKRWRTVAICEACWRVEEGGREPVRMTDPEPETCYRCGFPAGSGIYVRRYAAEKNPPADRG